MSPRIFATYWLETDEPPQLAAEIIAGEQSSGTFVALPNETSALKQRSGARVESIQVLEEVHEPSLSGRYRHLDGPFTRCLLTLSWPLENIGPSLTMLLSTIAGNLFELKCVSGLRVVDIQLPQEMIRANPGPAFGIEGTRLFSGVHRGPLIGTIIKPSVGLNPSETAEQAKLLVDAGIDFIKDDELQANGGYCPFDERVRAVMRVVNEAADRTGKKAMVAFNLTGELDEMKRRHDLVLEQGGTCVMVCMHSIGLVGMRALREHSQLPIHAHRAGWGYLSRAEALGWDYGPWQKIWRMAGADHLHVNGLGNKFSEPDESVVEAARAVLQPLAADMPMSAMPVFSSGQTGLQARETYRVLGGADLIHTVGGGIFGHPDGVRAGVEALRASWEAAMTGVDLHDHAKHSSALSAALGFWK